ncbi:uncharacterized protein LOC144345908, partial [Saccoglossus kowalevskii]
MAYIKPGIGRGFILIYQGHRYQKNKSTNTTLSWRCWRKTCRGRVTTDVFPIQEDARPNFVQITNQHNHEGEWELIQKEDMMREVKQKLAEDPSKPIKRVFNDAAGRREDRGEDVPVYASLRSRMHRCRQENLPPIPRRIEDVQIEGEWTRSWRGRRFLSLVDNGLGVLIFLTTGCLRILSEVSIVYIDGTFKASPPPYVQLVTIHGRYMGNVITLAYALMNGKRLEQYRRVLQHLKDRTAAAGRQFAPTTVISDYEMSIRQAFEAEFPGISVKGCYFHLTQCFWRKIQELGLVNAYNNHRRTQRLLRKVFALGYLPVALVRQNFGLLRRSRQARRVTRIHPAVEDFLEYVQIYSSM